LNALGLALIALIGLRPGLLYSVGLHLSAAASAGLVLWARPLAARLTVALPGPVALALGATLAAQLAVAPIIMVVFGELSLVAPISNLLAVAAVAPATLIGLGAGVVGTVAVGPARLLARCAEPFAAWILGVADVFDRPSWASVDPPDWFGWLVAVAVVVAALNTAAKS
jgi:competence protein ComEC